MPEKAELKLGAEPPRGMRDILPDEAELRDATAATILDVYRRYGFRRVETPALEHIQLLTRGEGGENEKLIYKVLKRGAKLDLAGAAGEMDLVDLGLRFDLTVPLVRYYANNHAALPRPLKAVQIGPVWRAERQQKGRYRQFTQCDIDILGMPSAVADVELILATTDALTGLGLRNLTVRINDRRLLAALAHRCGFEPSRADSVFIALDKLDKVDWPGVEQELTQAGHPPAAIAQLGRLLSRFGPRGASPGDLGAMVAELRTPAAEEALGTLEPIIQTLRADAMAGWSITFDPTLVRGMSYYTGPIFEITSEDFPSSIAGGGRYDKLIGKLLGKDVPATGFSIGFERVISLLLNRRPDQGQRSRRVALIFEEGKDDLATVLAAARALRTAGLALSVEARARNLGAQLDMLSRHGFDGFALFDGTGRPPVRWFGEPERRDE
ncbi:MAG: histidine--tRNA ligase [Candidatus Limnocylindria bacterium]